MKSLEIIRNIILIPVRFSDVNNDKSVYDLLEESGYYSNYKHILEFDIALALKDNLNIVSNWLVWSENKRDTNGWYFQKIDANSYEVGRFISDENEKVYMKFYSPCLACAIFIKKEIESIRSI